MEEEFFRDGNRIETSQPVENFDDLDEGFRPRTLWQRLLGKKR